MKFVRVSVTYSLTVPKEYEERAERELLWIIENSDLDFDPDIDEIDEKNVDLSLLECNLETIIKEDATGETLSEAVQEWINKRKGEE